MLRPFYVFNSKYCEVTYNRWAQIFPEITHLAPECNEKKKRPLWRVFIIETKVNPKISSKSSQP